MFRLPETPRPERYTLHLTVDPREDRFQGEATIALGVDKGLRAFAIHSADLNLEEVRLEDSRGPVPVREWRARAGQEAVELRLGRALRSGPATLHVTYTGPIRPDLRGLYQARSGRRRYAVTQLEATDARRVFPCFDEPAMKARFKIRVTTPTANTVISNAPEIHSERRGRWKTVEFAETPKLPTYLVALIVGKLEGSRVRRCGRTPIRVWHVPGKGGLTGFALEAAAASLARLERYFALPYPYAKLDLVAVPDFEFGAMENAGAVTFRESLLLVDPKTVTLQEKKRVAEVVAHELAHMWYGDLVTMAWWDDLWLNEAFATWMAFAVVDEWKPEWQMWLDFEHHRVAAFSLDALRNTHPIYTTVRSPEEATENFDAITYEKGASVVRMLERWLGASTFRKGVRRYIRRHQEANARAQDLWQALEEVSGRSVAPVVRSWIARPGFPLVEATSPTGNHPGRFPWSFAYDLRGVGPASFAISSRIARRPSRSGPRARSGGPTRTPTKGASTACCTTGTLSKRSSPTGRASHPSSGSAWWDTSGPPCGRTGRSSPTCSAWCRPTKTKRNPKRSRLSWGPLDFSRIRSHGWREGWSTRASVNGWQGPSDPASATSAGRPGAASPTGSDSVVRRC